MSIYQSASDVNRIGLPIATDAFYRREAQELPKITSKQPRVLNIGSGSEPSRKLAAINVDISPEGKPDVIADAHNLPFKGDVFSVVRASHLLEHIPPGELELTLEEWRRVLHFNGELHLAVPDADITFQEIVDGKTPKGDPAFSLEQSTAPLAQIFGLGYNNRNTDPRWLHKIIFSYALLEFFLKRAKFTQVSRRTRTEDLASICQIDDDSQNHYSYLVTARNERLPHKVEELLSEKAFRDKCRVFVEQNSNIPPTSFVLPVLLYDIMVNGI